MPGSVVVVVVVDVVVLDVVDVLDVLEVSDGVVLDVVVARARGAAVGVVGS